MTDHTDEPPTSGEPRIAVPTGLIDRISFEVMRWGAVILVLFMTLLIGLDALLRTFAGIAFPGTHDVVGLCLILLVLVALPYSWTGDHHVRMDMLFQTYGPVGRYLTDLVAMVGALALGGLIAWQAWNYVPQFIRVGTASPLLKIPYWPLAVVICLFAALFCLAVLYNMAQRTVRLARGDS